VLVFAHAGHWLVQLIYLVPLAVLVAVILVGRARDRREERAANAQVREDERE
jgi:membrane protein implicated in regulation of membrane protease activity